MAALTRYEQKQVREIAGWKAEPPALILEAIEAVTHPMVKVAERFIPEQSVKDAIEMAYRDAEILAHREVVADVAQVGDVHELRRGDLARCDQLAEHFARLASRNAVLRGASVTAGPLLSMELSMMFALKTAHTIGFCYGFTPEDSREKEYVLRALLIASAGNLELKQQAIVNLRSIEDVFVDELAEELTEEEAEAVVEQVVEQAMGSSVPLLGLAMQGLINSAVTYHTAQVAKRVFQQRWLRANGKVTSIAPDPRLARSRLTRAESVVAACFYWPSFVASMSVTFPALLVTGFLPRENVAVRGLADGRDAASHDVRQLKHRMRLFTGTRTAAPVEALPVPPA